MLFNSIHFLIFFPIVVLLYYILPHKLRWIWLLVASYYFYMSWNPKYVLLLSASTIITYLSGLLITLSNQIENAKKRDFQRKLWVALSFSSNLAILFFFKYFDFAVANMNRVLSHIGVQALNPAFDVILPVGISFYIFQALSYTMDTYRNEISAEKNLAKYALYVSFFPLLIAGPIERSKNLLVQINERHYFDYDNIKNGLLLMLWGFFQKIVVADRISIIVNEIYNNYASYSGVHILIATTLFALQIFCDFSAYSDIARGAAQVMGFRAAENFKRPYFAASIQEFWRRWHISLSTWFRDYLYIPLEGSRCSKWKKYRNVMITFLVSGLWHGASWNYLVWGGLHGTYQVIGDISKPFRNKVAALTKMNTDAFSHRLLKVITTFILVNFAWIFFRASGTSAALSIIKRIFFNFEIQSIIDKTLFRNIGFGMFDLILVVCSIFVLIIVNLLQENMDIFKALGQQNLWFRWLVYLMFIFGVLFVAIMYAGGASQEFIYFQF